MPHKNQLASKVTTLIQDGNAVINNLEIKPNVVIFLGMTGVGKSTLINYINGVPLVSFVDDKGKYRLKTKDTSVELPGMTIGHSIVTSCTRHPNIYTPEEKSYSYVDTAGFGDTGDPEADNDQVGIDKTKTVRVAQDIANAYFRKAITEKANALKIVLAVAHNDLNDRAGNLPKALRDLAYFMQGITSDNSEIVDKVKNSISIIVTKIEDSAPRIAKLEKEIIDLRNVIATLGNNAATGILTTTLQEKERELHRLNTAGLGAEQAVEISLRDFIEQSPSLGAIKNLRGILTHIVDQRHYALFTTPTEICEKTSDEAENILRVIEDETTLIEKADAKIGIKVSDENAGEVIKAIDDLSIMGKKLAKSIDKDIREKLQSAFVNNEDIQTIKTACETIKGYTTLRTLKDFIERINAELNLSSETMKEYEEFNQFLTFLVDLLPEADRGSFTDTKNWIKELELSEFIDAHIASANDILSGPQVKYDNNNKKLLIQGYHIKTSQVDIEIAKHAEIKSIEIQALHTLTIDKDLANTNPHCASKLQGVNLSMIAPRIIVNNDRTIDLSGKNGVSQAKAANGTNGVSGATVEVATSGNNGGSGGHGTNGMPGESGTSAGNLFIVADEFVNQDHLSVYLKGGDGAKGQEGGDGGNGGNGSGVTYKSIPHLFFPDGVCIFRDGWIPAGPEGQPGKGKFDQDWRLPGGDGGVGGNGGQGGQGGDAGKPGECKLIAAGKIINIGNKLHITGGKLGEDGAAGKPGKGGMHGRHAEGVWHRGGNPDNYWNGHAHAKPHYVNRGSASDGNKPSSAINTSGWVAMGKITRQNLQVDLLNYKILLELEVVKHPQIVGDFLNKFKEKCESIDTSDLQPITKQFLEEADALQVYFSQYRKKMDFIPFYYSLLNRVKDFAVESTRTPQEIKVLEYLYASILGNLARIHAEQDNLLIIDIHNYVKNLVDRDFAALKDIQADQLKQYYKEQYQGHIESKIEDARSFLDILQKDIKSRQNDIEPQVARLVQEVKDTRDDTLHDRAALEKKRQELEDALRKNLLLGALSIAVQGVGMMFPPAGPIIAGVVNAGIAMANEPSFESAMNFAGKVVEMKSQLGKLPNSTNVTKSEADLFKKVQEIAEIVKPLIKNAQALLKLKNEGDEKLAQVNSEIQKIDAYVIELTAYLDTVPTMLGSYLEGIVHDVESFQTALGDKSLAALDFSKLEIRRFCDNVKKNLKALVGKFEANSGFEDIVIKLEEAIEVSINISGRIQDYRDHMLFASYIAHLHTATVDAIALDPEYDAEVKKLNAKIQQNIVEEAYLRAIAAIKQWAFPFAEKFLSAIQNLETIDYATMARNLPILLRNIQNYKTNITSMDQAIMLSTFIAPPTMPFFTWSYEQHAEKIDALLKGERVILQADVSKSMLDAVKFQKINIKIQCKLSDKQIELDTLLQNSFRVSLEHNGHSYYKYFDNIYQITSDKPLEISYSFKMKPDGITPDVRNEVWNKMAQGDILLSPYTFWVMKIEEFPTAKTGINLFEQFKDTKHLFKISLTGEGSYVDISKVNSHLNLDRYYSEASDEGPSL